MAGDLRAALETSLRQPVRLEVAGRTDRGVHARGQVVSYAGPLPSLRSVNALLRGPVVVRGAEEMPEGFSARHDAVSRAYAYRLLTRRTPSPFERGRALWSPARLDLDALHACAAGIRGVRDFTAFTPTETVHQHFRRTIHRAEWVATGEDLLEFRIEADAFLRHMNRILVGTMLEVASGSRSVEQFGELLEGRPRAQAGRTVAPHGLFLVGVGY